HVLPRRRPHTNLSAARTGLHGEGAGSRLGWRVRDEDKVANPTFRSFSSAVRHVPAWHLRLLVPTFRPDSWGNCGAAEPSRRRAQGCPRSSRPPPCRRAETG